MKHVAKYNKDDFNLNEKISEKNERLYTRQEVEKLLDDYATHILLSYVRNTEHIPVKDFLK